MEKYTLNQAIVEDLKSRYRREAEHVDFQKMINTTPIFSGIGAIGDTIELLDRLGVKREHFVEYDTVEKKNLTSQNFINDDIGLPKTQALFARIKACEFEKGNPDIPPLVVTTHGNFLAITDAEIEKIIQEERSRGQQIILIMATDYHPAQARGNRIGIKFKIPVFWVGIYANGKAGEIIFYHPDYDLPCYRCIIETRYRFFDKNRLADHLKGDFRGAGKSSGLPMAARFIDSVLGHLVIGLIHLDVEKNQHGKLFRRLLNEGRNFIQCQLDPDYMLNEKEDIFSQIQGPDMIAFNTIFQRESKKKSCLDCFRTATGSTIWSHTDYTKENYREKLIALEHSVYPSPYGCGPYQHSLLNEYTNLFPVWENLSNQSCQGELK